MRTLSFESHITSLGVEFIGTLPNIPQQSRFLGFPRITEIQQGARSQPNENTTKSGLIYGIETVQYIGHITALHSDVLQSTVSNELVPRKLTSLVRMAVITGKKCVLHSVVCGKVEVSRLNG